MKIPAGQLSRQGSSFWFALNLTYLFPINFSGANKAFLEKGITAYFFFIYKSVLVYNSVLERLSVMSNLSLSIFTTNVR